MTKLSLIIPCYNEVANLPELVSRCVEVCRASGGEVVLVDNGSTDDTPAALRTLLEDAPGVRSVRVDINRGYGFGILAGLRAAKGDVLAWTHADMQTDPNDAVKGLQLFREAKNSEQLFVKGRRYGRPASDVLFTVGMSAFETLLLHAGLWDINAQPTMFPRAFFESWRNPPHDFSLDLFAYYHAKRALLTVRRFPVPFGVRAHGLSRWNVNLMAKKKFILRTMSYSLQLRRSLARNHRANTCK